MKNLLPAVLALAASIFLLVFPSGSGFWGGQYHRTTLLESQGPSILILLAFPLFLTLLPLVFHKPVVGIGASIVLWAFAILGGFSIGLFYIPSAGMLLIVASARLSANPSKAEF